MKCIFQLLICSVTNCKPLALLLFVYYSIHHNCCTHTYTHRAALCTICKKKKKGVRLRPLQMRSLKQPFLVARTLVSFTPFPCHTSISFFTCGLPSGDGIVVIKSLNLFNDTLIWKMKNEKNKGTEKKKKKGSYETSCHPFILGAWWRATRLVALTNNFR